MTAATKEEMHQKLIEISEMVDESLDKQLEDPKLGNMVQILTYDLQTPGKRLRPAIAYFTALALGGDLKSTIDIATSCELLHSASLMLDDIIDGDTVRHGKPTVQAAFSGQLGLMGTYVLGTKGLEIGISQSSEIGLLLVQTLTSLVVGASTELSWADWNEETYFDIIENKTGRLFESACAIGAIMSKRKDFLYTSKRFGLTCGMLYQLCDDYTDIKKSIQLQEPIGDIKNRNTTIPIIHAHHHTKKPEIKLLLKMYHQKVNLPDYALRLILNEIEECKSLEYLYDLIEHRKNTAISIAQAYPTPDTRKYLEALPQFMVDAQFEEIDMPNFNGSI